LRWLPSQATLRFVAAYELHNSEVSIMRAWMVTLLVTSAAGAGISSFAAYATIIATIANLLGLPLIVMTNEIAGRWNREAVIPTVMTLSGLLGLAFSGKNITPNWHPTASKLRSGKGRGICRPEIHLFIRPKLRARDLEHRRIEIGGRQACVGRQKVAHLACDNPGASCGFQHPRGAASRRSARNVGSVIKKDYRSEAAVVVLRDVADKARVVVHDEPSFPTTARQTGLITFRRKRHHT
jgi:hypothetical protein